LEGGHGAGEGIAEERRLGLLVVHLTTPEGGRITLLGYLKGGLYKVRSEVEELATESLY